MNIRTFTAVFLLLTVSVPARAANSPRIVCAQAVHDFGSVEGPKSVEHVFTLGNDGDAPLQIGNVRACCGAAATLAEKLIPPGSNTTLKIVFSLAGRSGRQDKSIYVSSNDPLLPHLRLRLVGEVFQPLSVQPDRVNFGILNTDATTNAEVRVVCSSNLHVNVTNVQADAGFEATFEEGADHNGWRIIVYPRPSGVGLVKGKVAVLTDHKDHPRIEIPVSAVVASDMIVVPQELVMSQTGPTPEPVVRYVALRSRAGKPFEILEVTAPDPDIKISHSAIASGGHRITLANVRPFETLNGRCLVITTDHPEMKRVTVPFLISHPK